MDLKWLKTQLTGMVILVSLQYQIVIMEAIISECLVILAVTIFISVAKSAAANPAKGITGSFFWMGPALVAGLLYEFFIYVPLVLFICLLLILHKNRTFGDTSAGIRPAAPAQKRLSGLLTGILFLLTLLPPVLFLIKIQAVPWFNLLLYRRLMFFGRWL